MTPSIRTAGERAQKAAHLLASQPAKARNDALQAIAELLEAHSGAILQANERDVAEAIELVKTNELSPSAIQRLRLSPAKLKEMISAVRAIAGLPEVLGRVLDRVELDSGLELEKISCPLGVLAVIFEARPDAVTQISALAIKSGNAAILKPGKEVEHTAAALVELIQQALRSVSLPESAVQLVLGRKAVAELLALNEFVDLVIPRGSKSLVEYVQSATRIPVLGHAEGICHIYVDEHADAGMALDIIEDAKTDYPAACNAAETVLVHSAIAGKFLPLLAERMRAAKVHLLGCEQTRQILAGAEIDPPGQWNKEYGDLTLAVRVIQDMEAAIEHIHQFGSRHTESIVTADEEKAERFLRNVDAAGVYHNASTRFADGYRYGLGAEVGVSTSKFHARGPVGLEGLTTYKYLLRGTGQLVRDYHGSGAKTFTHRHL